MFLCKLGGSAPVMDFRALGRKNCQNLRELKKTLENLQVTKQLQKFAPRLCDIYFQEKMIRFIPDAAMLESILRDTSLMDPYQYIQHVLNMRGVTLDTETVWPVPSTIF